MSFRIVWFLLRQTLEPVNTLLLFVRILCLELIDIFLGSTMFAGISRLLKFLKKSFQNQSSRNPNSSTNNQDEHEFQTAVISGIGDFAEKLPDFQMMEIMQFIVTSLPSLNQGYEGTTDDSKCVFALLSMIEVIDCLSRTANLKLQLLLLKTVQRVR